MHIFPRVWWWLPPVVWPEEEDSLTESIVLAENKGSRYFVLNTPWQTGLIHSNNNLNLWAGPFCNLSNPMALTIAADLGFSGGIISPELGGRDILSLPSQSPLPLGIVIGGNWPLCISRTIADSIKMDQPFTSPKGEIAWVHRYGPNYWVFPNWKLNLKSKEYELRKAGFQVFIQLVEPKPKLVELKKRPGLWNWDIGLK
jgi:putative protease